MGKPSPPPPPDYTPLIASQQATAASDAAAAQVQADVAMQQLAVQDKYAARSADLGDLYAQMAQEQNAWGEQQYEDLKPYLQSYMQAQLDWQGAAQSNEEIMNQQQQQALDQSKQTYDRYMSTYAPKEDQFLQEAYDYASPARMDQNAAAARGDVATAFSAQSDAASRSLQSYGVDPSQGAYGRTQAMDISRAAAEAAAGTMARTSTEAQGKQYELAALQVGQKLPAQAIGQATLGMQMGSSGLAGSAIGGGGVAAGSTAMGAGTTAMGSPTSYASISNPYTTLSGQYGTQGVGMYGAQNQALGNAGTAITGAISGMDSSYSAQMQNYAAQASASPWGAIGSILGGVAGVATKFI